MSLLRKHWFLAALAVSVAAGLLYPGGGAKLRAMNGVLSSLTAASLFLSGLSLDTTRLRGTRELGGVLLGLSSTYVVAPLAALALGMAWGPPGPGTAGSESYFFIEAMVILAAQAGTIASAPALTLIAGGNQALALLITVCSQGLTSFLTPLILQLSIGAVVVFPIGEMMWRLANVVLLPVIVAQLVRRGFSDAVRPLLPRAVRASQVIILVFVYTGVSAAAGALAGRPALIARFFCAAVMLHLVLLVFTDRGARWAGLSTASRAAVVLCGSQKTLPNGIYVWSSFFAQNPYGAVALVLYHVLQLVLDTLLVPWLQEKPGVAAEALSAAEKIVDGA